MERKFILACESTVDMTYEYISSRDIPVIFYTYTVDDAEYVDDMERDPKAMDRFYDMLKAGKMPHTSQINQVTYEEFMEPLVQQGDLLFIAFGSGMSGSVNNAIRAGEALRERYSDRKVVVIDSLCSSTGYGMLVETAADMRDEGKSIDECEAWVLANRNTVHHQFFCTDLTMFRRSGRMSGPAATLATILNICPILRLNSEGRIICYDKARGKKKAIAETVKQMLLHVQNGADYDGKCYICNARCVEDAEALREKVEETFPKLKGKVKITNIGTIITSHCGQGIVAVFFYGDERQP